MLEIWQPSWRAWDDLPKPLNLKTWSLPNPELTYLPQCYTTLSALSRFFSYWKKLSWRSERPPATAPRDICGQPLPGSTTSPCAWHSMQMQLAMKTPGGCHRSFEGFPGRTDSAIHAGSGNRSGPWAGLWRCPCYIAVFPQPGSESCFSSSKSPCCKLWTWTFCI